MANLQVPSAKSAFMFVWPELIVIALAVPMGLISDLGTAAMVQLTLLLIGQNMSFTLVSRARQMASIKLHAFAAVGSNGFYIFVLAAIVANYDSLALKAWYIICTVVGSVHAHHIALHKLEKVGAFKKGRVVSQDDLDAAVALLRNEFAAQLGGKKPVLDTPSQRSLI